MISLLSSVPQAPPYSAPIAVAAQNGHTQIIEGLLEAKANVNYQDQVRRSLVLLVSCKVF